MNGEQRKQHLKYLEKISQRTGRLMELLPALANPTSQAMIEIIRLFGECWIESLRYGKYLHEQEEQHAQAQE